MKNNFYSTIMCALLGIMMTVVYLPNASAQNNFDINDLKTWANYERYAESRQNRKQSIRRNHNWPVAGDAL